MALVAASKNLVNGEVVRYLNGLNRRLGARATAIAIARDGEIVHAASVGGEALSDANAECVALARAVALGGGAPQDGDLTATVIADSRFRLQIGLSAADTAVPLGHALLGDELGSVVPWALVLADPRISVSDFLAESSLAPSPRAFLFGLRQLCGADSAILWVFDADLNDKISKGRMVARVTTGMRDQDEGFDIPIGRGLVGRLKATSPVQAVGLDDADIYNRDLVRREGWVYCVAAPLALTGRLFGAVSLYFRQRPREVPDFERIFADHVLGLTAVLRRCRKENQREVELRDTEIRLERLQQGVEALAFAHDLANAAKNANDGREQVSAWLATPRGERKYSALKSAIDGMQSSVGLSFELTRAMTRLLEGRNRERTTFDPAVEVEQLQNVLRALCPQMTITTASGIAVAGSILDFQRIVINLVSNAAYWSKIQGHQVPSGTDSGNRHKPSVALSIARENSGEREMMELRIIDNGPGMTLDDSRKAFDLMFSGRKDGTGLGLWVVKRLIRNFEHGEVWFDRSARSGTEAVVRVRCRSW